MSDVNDLALTEKANVAVNAEWSSIADGTVVTVDGKDYIIGTSAFSDLTAAFAAAETAGGDSIIVVGDDVVGQPKTAEGIEINTAGVYELSGTQWANVGYLQFNSDKNPSSGRMVLNITDSNLVATKLQGRMTTDINITDSHVDFADNTSRGYICIYTDSTMTVKNSVVGFDSNDGNSAAVTAGRDGDVITLTNSDPCNAVYLISGVLTAENSTLFAFSHEDGNFGGFCVYDKALVSIKDSAVYAGSILIGMSTSDDKKTVGRDEEIAEFVLDNSVLRRANSDRYGLWVGYTSGVAGKLVVKNNSEIYYGSSDLNIASGSTAEIIASKVDFANINVKGALFFSDSVIDGQTIKGSGGSDAFVYAVGGGFKNSSADDLVVYFCDTTVEDSAFTGGFRVYSGYGITESGEWDYFDGSAVTVKGTVDAAAREWFNYDKLIVADGASLNVNYYGDTAIGSTEVSGTFNAVTYRSYVGVVNEGGKIVSDYVNLYGRKDGAAYTVNGIIETKQMLIGFDTMKQDNGEGGWWYIGGAKTEITVSGDGAGISVDGNAIVNKDEENNMAVLNVENDAVFSAETLTNNGVINISGGSITAGTLANSGTITIDGSKYTSGTYKVIDTDSRSGNAYTVDDLADGMFVVDYADGDVVITDGKYYVDPSWSAESVLPEGMIYGVNAFSTLNSAVSALSSETVSICVRSDISGDYTGIYYSGNIITDNTDGVTITNTGDNYVYIKDLTIGDNVTFCSDYIFYSAGVNNIDGVVKTGDANGIFYHGYDTVTCISGKVEVNGTTISRYNNSIDSGIYVTGNAETGKAAEADVSFYTSYYIGHYSGTFSVRDAAVEAGYILLNNTYDGNYAAAVMTIDNGSLKTIGTSDGQGQMIIDGDARFEVKNNSSVDILLAMNVADGTCVIFSNMSSLSVGTTLTNDSKMYFCNSSISADTVTGSGIIYGSGVVEMNFDSSSSRVFVGGYHDENGNIVYHDDTRSALALGSVDGNGLTISQKEFRVNNADITLNDDMTVALDDGKFFYLRKSELDLNGNDLTITSGKFLSTGLDITGKGTVYITAGDQPCFQTFASSIGKDVTLKATKQFTIYEDLTVYGTVINEGSTGNGVTHIGFNDDFWSDGTVFTLSGEAASFTQTGRAGIRIHKAYADKGIEESKLVVKDGASFSADGKLENQGTIEINSGKFDAEIVENTGNFNVSGTSSIVIDDLYGRDNGQGGTNVGIYFAADTVLYDTVITVKDNNIGSAATSGDLTVNAGAFKGFKTITVNGDLSVTDCVLPSDSNAVIVLAGNVLINGGSIISINGADVESDGSFQIDGIIYNVANTAEGISISRGEEYDPMSGSVNGYSQSADSNYIFDLSCSVAGGVGSKVYSIQVFDGTEELDILQNGTRFVLQNDPTSRQLTVRVTVSDKYSSVTFDDFAINVFDYTAPGFSSKISAELSAGSDGKANDALLSWNAVDNFAVASFTLEINGVKYYLDGNVTEFALSDLANGDYAVKITAYDAAGNSKYSSTDFAVKVQPSADEQPAARNDFNGDGKSDIVIGESPVFKILASREEMPFKSTALSIIESDYDVIAAGYFNGDEFADVLIRNKYTGELEAVYSEYSNGKFSSYQEALDIDGVFNYGDSSAAGAEWTFAQTGDINGDGIDDVIVSKNFTDGGKIYCEYAAYVSKYNGSFEFSGSIGAVDTAQWTLSGVADMDGDNKDDIVWINKETQLIGYWSSKVIDSNLQAGTSVNPWISIAEGADGWSFVGLGDFDGDKVAEALWQHEDGLIGFWQEKAEAVNGSTFDSFITLGFATEMDEQFTISALGDYNGDGRTDILWSADSGEKQAWMSKTDSYEHTIVAVAY